MIDLDRFWEGEEEYFDELVCTFGPRVYRVAAAHSLDIDHADDLYQEIWSRVYERRRSYSGSGRFAAWIRQVARNVCVEDYRTRRARGQGVGYPEALEEAGIAEAGKEDPLAKVESEETNAALHRALGHLTERQREVIQLWIFEDWDSIEVAGIMGIAQATVRSLFRRAISRLRKELEESPNEVS